MNDTAISPKEIVELCALDDELFGRFFFPRAFRQESPPFLRSIDAVLAKPENRYCAFKMYRGSSKTTRLRKFTAKRIAYGISHTILYISRSQGHSIKSIEWLKNAVEFNKNFAEAFQLRPGKKWTGEEIEIVNGIDEYPIRVIALGITGQLVGFNIEDYRPDLIVVDDPDGPETTSSPEQIAKTAELFFGSIKPSLAPRSEAPDAKLVIAQTPNEAGDLIETCCKDPQFVSLEYGCYDEQGQSRWEVRFPTAELDEEKRGYIARNQLSIWLKNMEVTISAAEQRAFDLSWLKYWTATPLDMICFIVIDPASSDAKTADFQACGVVGFYEGQVYLCEYVIAKGQDPEELAVEFFRMVRKWKPVAAIVESVAYQRVLAWYLRNAMARHKTYIVVHEVQDKRAKGDRIIQAISGRASSGNLFIYKSMTEFEGQYAQYPSRPTRAYAGKDDILDVLAMAITFEEGRFVEIEGEYSTVTEPSYKPLQLVRSAP